MEHWKRLIIIDGMARTGTTAMASYIGSHPDVKLVVCNRYWHLCENELIRLEEGPADTQTIDRILRQNPNHRILIKQPWASFNLPFMFMVLNLGGKIVTCFREKESLFESWAKTKYVHAQTKNYPRKTYDIRIEYDLKTLEMGALRVDLEELSDEHSLGGKISEYLGLNLDGFSSERLKKRWAEIMEREWVMANSIFVPRKLKLIRPFNQGG